MRDYAGQDSTVSGFSTFVETFSSGDDRLRQRDTRHRLLLIGIAAVPVTHMLHTIDAENGILAKAREIAGKVRLPQLVPVLA